MLVYTLVVAAVGAVKFALCSLLPSSGVGALLLKGVICVLLPNAAFLLLSFRTREFKVVAGKLKELLKRKS